MKSISILMSLYNPNESFLFKQLDSINNQDYKGPIEVLVHNDNPKDMDRELQISDHLPNCTVSTIILSIILAMLRPSND